MDCCVPDVGDGVSGAGCCVPDVGAAVPGVDCCVPDVEDGVSGAGCCVPDVGDGVSGAGCCVPDVGAGVPADGDAVDPCDGGCVPGVVCNSGTILIKFELLPKQAGAFIPSFLLQSNTACKRFPKLLPFAK